MPIETTPFTYRFVQDSTYFNTRFGTTSVLAQNNSVVTSGTYSRLTNKNPNWRQQVARKQDATTDYYKVARTSVPCRLYGESYTPFTFNGQQYYIIGRDFVSFVDGESMITDVEDTALRDIALARIKRRLSDNIGDWGAIAPVAELRETRGLITGLAHSATGMIKALIDIKRTKGRSAYKYASEVWLTWSFGVKPLLSDIRKANESISEYLTRVDKTLKLSGTASKKWRTSLKNGGSTGAYNAPFSRFLEADHSLSYRYAGGFDLRLRSGNNYGIDDHFGLDIGSLPSVAWELTPFSWVFDYFTTAGAYLEDTFVLPSGSLKYFMLQRRYLMICKITGTHVPAVGTYLGANDCLEGQQIFSNFSRTKLTSLPYRSLRFKTVDEIGKNAVNKLLNLASVLGSSSRLRR